MTKEAKLPLIHPGEVLNEEFLRPMNITQYRLAKSIGVDARRIHSIVRGERAVTAETALLLAGFFSNSPLFWMGLQSQYDLEATRDRLAERLDRITERRQVSAAGTRYSLSLANDEHLQRTTNRLRRSTAESAQS